MATAAVPALAQGNEGGGSGQGAESGQGQPQSQPQPRQIRPIPDKGGFPGLRETSLDGPLFEKGGELEGLEVRRGQEQPQSQPQQQDQPESGAPDAAQYPGGPITVMGKQYRDLAHLEQSLKSLRGTFRTLKQGSDRAQALEAKVAALESALTQRLEAQMEAEKSEKGKKGTEGGAEAPPFDPSRPPYETLDWKKYNEYAKTQGHTVATAYLLDHVGQVMDARFKGILDAQNAVITELKQRLDSLNVEQLQEIAGQHETHAKITHIANKMQELRDQTGADGAPLYPTLKTAPEQFYVELGNRMAELDVPPEQALTPRVFRALVRDIFEDVRTGSLTFDGWSPFDTDQSEVQPQTQRAGSRAGFTPGQPEPDVLTPGHRSAPSPRRMQPRSAEDQMVANLIGKGNRDKEFGILP